ncbi:hypothetical protein [Dongia deserti]|uniref:hypothetical protein n=1 Tax=Dongia deserti TaxID=2268030 RepID=UPI000E653227|nr:hypothetical protein [Dongia deserti]
MIDQIAITAIEGLAAKLVEAWNRHDAQPLASIFANDPWPRREGLLNWIATRHGDSWLVDVSHDMDLPSPDLVEAQAALINRRT